ncbi:hypothetical protein N7513_003507 [Penicillium frequentans]|nr:hypothetical protein N7513_003507 [Penicillium glabrum]
MRIEKRKRAQYLTVVNPRIRAAKRLPLLDMAEEMAYYRIFNPYGRSDYYRNHYICLWEATEEEVVGTWAWEDLCKDANWYENVILLEYSIHNQKAHTTYEDDEKLDLSELGIALPALDEHTEGEYSSDDGRSSFSERKSWHEGSDWDTDDEVEEANATDDMFKMLEGDWS